MFSPLEKHILHVMLSCRTDEPVTTDQVNRILGVGRKSPSVQKKARSETFRSIESKFKLLAPECDTCLIMRMDAAIDKRVKSYMINEKYTGRVTLLLNTHAQPANDNNGGILIER